jgi:hypothetical protein
MRSIRRSAPLLILLMACSAAWAQQKAGAWDGWQFLKGKWVGEGSSELGEGSGYFSFEPDLQNKAWVRRNHSEYPATKDRPKSVHEDLMIVYVDEGAGQTRAFYYDTEGHVINYTARFSSDRNRLTFLSDTQAGAPRYRLTYVRSSPGHMTVTLEIARPEKPDEFQKIVEGKVRKAASR